MNAPFFWILFAALFQSKMFSLIGCSNSELFNPCLSVSYVFVSQRFIEHQWSILWRLADNSQTCRLFFFFFSFSLARAWGSDKQVNAAHNMSVMGAQNLLALCLHRLGGKLQDQWNDYRLACWQILSPVFMVFPMALTKCV